MIKASEALILFNNSESNVKKYTDLIDPYIRNSAIQGKRSYECYVDGLWGSVEINSFSNLRLTEIQKLVTKKLKEFGYIVSLGRSGDSYVPRGLADDVGGGPAHVNVCLIISW